MVLLDVWVGWGWGVGMGAGNTSAYCENACIVTAGSPSLEWQPLVGDWLPSSSRWPVMLPHSYTVVVCLVCECVETGACSMALGLHSAQEETHTF